jgi:hypothetical protein
MRFRFIGAPGLVASGKVVARQNWQGLEDETEYVVAGDAVCDYFVDFGSAGVGVTGPGYHLVSHIIHI